MAAGAISSEVDGDKLVVKFTSDSSVNAYGFDITGYSWTDYTGFTHEVAYTR